MRGSLIYLLICCVLGLFSCVAPSSNTSGFDMAAIELLTTGEDKGMSDVEEQFGAPFEKTEIAKSDNGCVEAWFYSEVIMRGMTVASTQVLTVFFDEDGYVCSTYITDGSDLDESLDRP
jgi:hypothetical protein